MKRLLLPGDSTASFGRSHFWIPIRVGRRGGELSQPLPALVDTGSTYTWIPRDTLESRGISPDRYHPFQLADGREVNYPVGWIDIRLPEGPAQPTIVVFAPAGTEPILGVVTLEEFGLAADPVNERLLRVPARAKRLKHLTYI